MPSRARTKGRSTVTTEAVVETGGAVAAGVQLSQARQASGLSQEQAATQLHVPLHVIAALENGQWERLGAPVFIRGQLRSYARLLKVDPAHWMALVPAEQLTPVPLVSRGEGPDLRRHGGALARKLAYAVLAVAVVTPAGFLLRSYLQQEPAVASLDDVPAAVAADNALALPVPASTALASGPAPAPAAAITSPAPQAGAGAVAGASTPVQAAASTASPASVAANGAQLLLKFAGDSWIEIAGPQGQVVEKTLVMAGQQRSYPAGDVARVLLGNSTQVQASMGGRAIDLTTMGRSNVARFTVSSDGSVSPVSN